MKLNWNTFKVVFALVVVIGTIFWAMDSVRPHFHSGANLNFSVGSGPVSVTNPSNQPVPVQLVGAGSRSFSVSSTIEGVSGSSTRQGSGSTSTHVFEFSLPSGISEFTIARGTNVNFGANTETKLEATVQPVSASESRTTIIVAVVVVLVALFYISRITGHRWLNALRGKETPAPVFRPLTADGGQGGNLRSYGDNRVDSSH